ncbi:MAG: DUF4251 domain-containing protein [Ginsengibacter sp.]
MRTIIPGIKLSLLFFITMLSSNCSSTRNTTSYKNDSSLSAIKNMIDMHKFVFVAETMSPLRGRLRNLTSGYDVRVSPDTLMSDLPYFGRAYTAPLDPSQGGIKFTSTKFSYDVSQEKSNKWNIVIRPGDGQDVRQLIFTVFENGTASLNVTSNSRDAISFNGRLKKRDRD